MHEIWKSISMSASRGLLSEAQKRELKNRLAEHIASPGDVVSWEQIKIVDQRMSERLREAVDLCDV